VQQWCSEHPWEIRAEDKAGQCVDQDLLPIIEIKLMGLLVLIVPLFILHRFTALLALSSRHTHFNWYNKLIKAFQVSLHIETTCYKLITTGAPIPACDVADRHTDNGIGRTIHSFAR